LALVDISLPLYEGMPIWPGSPETEIKRIATLEEQGVNGTAFCCDSHAGTHIDAPLHFLDGGLRWIGYRSRRWLGRR
jgi:arylformamidase